MEIQLFSDAIINEAMDVFKLADQSTLNEHALQLFSDADDDDNSNNGPKTSEYNSALDGVSTSHGNAVITVCNSASAGIATSHGNTVTSSSVNYHQQEPGLSSNVKETDSYPVEVENIANANAVTSHLNIGINTNMEIVNHAVNIEMISTPLNSIDNNINAVDADPEIPVTTNCNTESDDDTIIDNDSSDTGMTLLAEDADMEINLNSTTDYTNQEANSSDTEVGELILNRCTSQTYSRVKKTLISRVTKDLPAPTPPSLCTNIDMLEDNTNTDTNAELLNLSDTFADSLVIMDLEELMNENELTQQTILPTRPQSPRGSFTYRFQGIRRKSGTPVSAGENKYKCPTCPKTWNTRGKMCEHYRNSHPPLPCTDCNMTFTSPLSLAQHSYKHKERPYECEVCGEKFAFNSELSQHSPVHKE